MRRLRAFVAGGMLLLAIGAQAKPVVATLKGEVDSRWSKPGDKVTLELKEPVVLGDVTAPRGAQIRGHVIGVAKQKHPSGDHLGLVFDELLLKDGRVIPVRVMILELNAPSWTALGGDSYSQWHGASSGYAEAGSPKTFYVQDARDGSSGYISDYGFVDVLRGSKMLLKISAAH